MIRKMRGSKLHQLLYVRVMKPAIQKTLRFLVIVRNDIVRYEVTLFPACCYIKRQFRWSDTRAVDTSISRYNKPKYVLFV